MAHQEQKLQPVDDGVDGQHRLPVLAQNVQAHVAFQVNVGMIYLRRGTCLLGPALHHCRMITMTSTSWLYEQRKPQFGCNRPMAFNGGPAADQQSSQCMSATADMA